MFLFVSIAALLLAIVVEGFHPQFQRSRTVGPLYGGGPIRGDTLPQLLRTIEASGKGVQQDSKAQIIDMINLIGQQNMQFVQNDRKFLDKISGKW